MMYEVIMARWKGLEPPTFWFVAKHSIQLSYQRVFAIDSCCNRANYRRYSIGLSP